MCSSDILVLRINLKAQILMHRTFAINRFREFIFTPIRERVYRLENGYYLLFYHKPKVNSDLKIVDFYYDFIVLEILDSFWTQQSLAL